jgi:hypothetical protein
MYNIIVVYIYAFLRLHFKNKSRAIGVTACCCRTTFRTNLLPTCPIRTFNASEYCSTADRWRFPVQSRLGT